MNAVSMSLLAKNNCHMRERANVNIHTYIHTCEYHYDCRHFWRWQHCCRGLYVLIKNVLHSTMNSSSSSSSGLFHAAALPISPTTGNDGDRLPRHHLFYNCTWSVSFIHISGFCSYNVRLNVTAAIVVAIIIIIDSRSIASQLASHFATQLPPPSPNIPITMKVVGYNNVIITIMAIFLYIFRSLLRFVVAMLA